MKRSVIAGLSILAILFAFTVMAPYAFAGPGAPSPKPNPPSQVCYAFDNYETDFLMLSITPGQQAVYGKYRQCVAGANPGTGTADVLMFGTIQNVPLANTIPYAPVLSDIRTQMSLAGSIASGNFGGDPLNKASRCWLHLVFQDAAMTTGTALGACEWFSGSGTPPFSTADRFREPIHQVPCTEVVNLVGSCQVPD